MTLPLAAVGELAATTLLCTQIASQGGVDDARLGSVHNMRIYNAIPCHTPQTKDASSILLALCWLCVQYIRRQELSHVCHVQYA